MSTLHKAPDDPLWYKDAIIYELHVRAFSDGDGDGVGDFRGLTEKLDYLEDLGVNTLWLLPFYPSPLKDDGYDISDYAGVHPSYGTLADFKTFMKEAHRRGLRVVTELVVNHTSDQHPWFQRARRAAPGDPARDWYVWSPTPDRYENVRIIFSDFEPSNWSWDAVAKAYYWHRFYSHQPDLNFDHPEVAQAILKVADFWLEQGVDGFRLDAIPYLYEREGTACEDLPETHAFLRTLRHHVDSRYPNRMLLAEANQWPEDAATYYGKGDECHMAFHFPIMTRLFLALHMEDRYPMVDILAQTPALPDCAQWALFLRNHDELTLEMVTDQERDYMYRVYAQDRAARINLGIRRRLAPLLQNNRKKIELLNALLFSLPGTPVVYYGDEIGMGDNIFLGDRNGVRTPMQWSGDRNAGFSRANAQRLYLPVIVDPEYHYEAVNVEAQQANPQSLLWWMKRLLALSRRFKAFGRGTFELLTPENRKVLAFIRRYQDEVILVVANLSRFAQYVELDLRSLKGRVPVELFGRTAFPRIGEAPFLLTLGPHAFYWFSLDPVRETAIVTQKGPDLRVIEIGGEWTEAFSKRARRPLESALLDYVRHRPWFAGRSKTLRSFRVVEWASLAADGPAHILVLVQVDYQEGEPETYSIPLSFADGEQGRKLKSDSPEEVIAELRMVRSGGGGEGVLYNALADESFLGECLRGIADGTAPRSSASRIAAWTLPGFDARTLPLHEILPAQQAAGLLQHTTLSLRGRLTFKWYHHVQEGLHPELELSRFGALRSARPPIVSQVGYWELLRKGREPITLAAIQQAVPNPRNAWDGAMDELGRFCESIRSLPSTSALRVSLKDSFVPDLLSEPTPEALALVGPYIESVRRMAECVARFHRVMAEDPENPDFSPEPLTTPQVRSAYQALRRKSTMVFPVLRRAAKHRSPSWGPDAERLIAVEHRLLQAYQDLLKKAVRLSRIRCHGELNLTRFISAGSEFLLTDLPGPWNSPFIERRIKRLPLWDVAGLLSSFHDAACLALEDQASLGEIAVDRWSQLESGVNSWYVCVAQTFWHSYRKAMAESSIDLGATTDVAPLLRASLLERNLELLNGALTEGTEELPAILRRLLVLVEGTAEAGSSPPAVSEARNGNAGPVPETGAP